MSVPYKASDNDDTRLPTIIPDSYKNSDNARQATQRKAASQVQRKVSESVNREDSNKSQSKPEKKTVQASQPKDAPVFKLQIFVSSRALRKGDAHFKGETDYDSYQEGNMYKYTMGNSTNYNDIYRLRKSLSEKFPEAFIIAFKNGQKYDVNQAIRDFKQNRNR